MTHLFKNLSTRFSTPTQASFSFSDWCQRRFIIHCYKRSFCFPENVLLTLLVDMLLGKITYIRSGRGLFITAPNFYLGFMKKYKHTFA